jgi:hypothetical protein
MELSKINLCLSVFAQCALGRIQPWLYHPNSRSYLSLATPKGAPQILVKAGGVTKQKSL